MDFTLSESQQQYAKRVRSTLELHVSNTMRESVRASGASHDRALAMALADAGLLSDATPGPGCDPIKMHLFFSEMEKAGAPFEGLAVNLLVAGLLELVGEDLHREQVVAPLLAGAQNICLGYSEPGAGSDLTAVSTRARRDGDGWVIDGQKLWTTMAQDSRWMLALTCTDPHAARRRGSTMFLIPMDTPGVEVTPVMMMGGDRVNSVFLSGVRVSDAWRVGEIDAAWDVMGLALSLERGLLGNSQLGVHLLAGAVAWFASSESGVSGPLIEDSAVREAIAAIAVENHIGRLLGLGAAAAEADGGIAGSMVKVYVSERYVRNAQRLQDLAGEPGLRPAGVAGAAAGGELEHHVRHSPVTRIAGGTTEINRNLIAERHLGLPRHR